MVYESYPVKNMLLISPYFAPMAVIGAKRALNLSRHLPRYGWRPVILASEATRERVDLELNHLIGQDAVISRTYRRPRPGQVLPPSKDVSHALPPQQVKQPSLSLLERITGWQTRYLSPFDREWVEVKHATREGIRLGRLHQVEAVSVSVDPWSALMTASRVSQALKVPLVVDFRDPWSLHSGKSKLRPPPTLSFMKWYERKIFARAAKVILNTSSCEQAYRDRDGQLFPTDRFTFIRNAFDASMFGVWQPPRPLQDRPFELTYFGQFRKFVRPDALFAGLAHLISTRTLTPEQFRLVMISPLDGYGKEAAQRFQIEAFIDERPSVSFSESFTTLQQADALALVDGGCPLVIAGKLYDYLCAGRPILSVARSSEVAHMISSSQSGINANPDDPQHIADALWSLITERKAGNFHAPQPDLLNPFGAENQARCYAEVLDKITSPHLYT